MGTMDMTSIFHTLIGQRPGRLAPAVLLAAAVAVAALVFIAAVVAIELTAPAAAPIVAAPFRW